MVVRLSWRISGESETTRSRLDLSNTPYPLGHIMIHCIQTGMYAKGALMPRNVEWLYHVDRERTQEPRDFSRGSTSETSKPQSM